MRFVLLCGFVWVPCATVQASSLFGRVVEVNSGDLLTVFNLNRPVRVKLLGVAAPELGQPFGDVAKKHLSDLVYDKPVLVEYSGMSADGSLAGRVLLNNADIGAQMIRDGVAWFDSNNLSRLSATDREVYQQSEQAARNERRGLWQAEKPMAPWEFVRATSVRNAPVASLNSTAPAAKPKGDRPFSELTNLTLMASRIAAAAPAPVTSSTDNNDIAWAMGDYRRNWKELRPAGENFSALVPEEGKLVTIPVPAGDQIVETHAYMARDGLSFFSLTWVTAPTYGETDKDAIHNTLSRFLQGFGDSYQTRHSSSFSCELQNKSKKNISMSGYTGIEFDLGTCTVPAQARVFTRVVDGQRQMYLGAVFYVEEDENVARFLKSFTVGPAQKTKAQRH